MDRPVEQDRASVSRPRGVGRRRVWGRLVARLWLGLWLALAPLAAAAADDPDPANDADAAAAPHSVLLLQSYHPGLSWSDGMEQGVRAGLAGADIALSIEYLDSKRRPLEDVAPAMADFLGRKYAGAQPDVIIAADNNALAFLRQYEATLFPDSAIVFAGINHFRPALLAGLGDRATGVVERIDPLGTGRLIRRLRPQTERLIVVSGTTTTGRAVREETERALSGLGGSLEIVWWDDLAMDPLLARLEGLGPRDAVLLTVVNRDAAGRYFAYEDSARMIAAASAAPVFGLWDFYLGTGVVGGRVADAVYQGETAAGLALQLLSGAAPADIAIVRDLLVTDQFDAAAMARFDIPRDLLPDGSQLVNDDRTWLARHWRTVVFVVALMIAEALALAALAAVVVVMRRRAARQSREAALRRAATLHSIGDAVIGTDAQGRVVEMNPVAETLTGWAQAEAQGRPFEQVARLIDGVTGRPLESPVGRALADGQVCNLPEGAVLIDRTGQEKQIADSAAPIRDARGAVIGVVLVFRDVTAEEAAHAEIRRLNQRFAVAAEAASIGVWEYDPARDSLHWDDGMFALYGVVREDFPGAYEAWAQGVHPEDLPRAHAEVQRAIHDHVPFDTSFRVMRPDGAIRHIRAFAQMVGEGEGQQPRLIGVNYDITDRTELLQRLTKISRNLPGAIYQYRRAPDGTDCMPYASDGLYDIFGLAPEAVGEDARVLFDAVHPEDLPRLEASIRASQDELQVWNDEFRVLHPQKGEIWITGSAQPERQTDGSTMWHGFLTDITDRRRTEEALAASERRFRDIAETMSDWIWEIDVDMRFTYVSGNVAAVLGYSAAELLGRSCLDTIVDPDPAIVAERFRDVAARRAPIEALENWNRTKDGRHVCLLTSGVPMIDAAGRLVGYRGMDKDITDRKRIEEELKLRDRALEAAANGVLITRADDDQPIVYCNPAFEAMTGYGRDQVLGRNCRFLQNDDRDQPSLASMRQAFAEGRPFNGLLRNYRKDGSLFWNQCSIAPVTDGQGRITHFVGIQQDVTERQRYEAELRHAWKAAEVANKTKSEFLAMMSHELRTPLNAINGFSEMMKCEIFGPLGDPHYQDYAQHIHASGEYLLALINDVLDMSKIEAGKMTLNEEFIAVADAAETALSLVAERASNHGLLLVTRLQPDLPSLWADQRAIKQVLLNLLSNAIKFTPAGGRIELAGYCDGEGAVVLEVSDTGIGIDPNEQQAVLEPFHQANNRLSAQREGTGLGLSLVKALVELHGGTIHLTSCPNKGTTVSIRLPPARTRTPIAAE